MGRKLTRLSNKQRLKMIEEVKAGIIDKQQAMEKYNISRKTLWTTFKKEKILREMGSSLGMKERKANKFANDRMLEEALIAWFHETSELGGTITGPMIQQKALTIYDKLEAEAQNRETVLLKGKSRKFVASEGWLDRFKKRHGIRKMIVKEEIHSSDTEEADLVQKESKRSSGLIKMIAKKEVLSSDTEEADLVQEESKRSSGFRKVIVKEEIHSTDTEEAVLVQEESRRSFISAEEAYQCFNTFSWLETQKAIAISEEDLIVVRRLKKLVEEHVAPENCAESNFINL